MDKGVKYFIDQPSMLEKSSGKFINNYYGKGIFKNCSREYINQCKAKARQLFKNSDLIEVNNYVSELEDKIIEQETDHKTGDRKLLIESTKPLTPKQIEEMVGVDNISTFVDRSWLKSHKNGTWTYSVLTVCKIKDFYNKEELTYKIKEIFSETKPFKSNIKIKNVDKALFVYISDDHVGLILKNSLYDKEYSGSIYANRLIQIVEEIKNLETSFEEINIIRLGDELDGWNAKTTRADRSLESLSNKEQFDIYSVANRVFYNELFSSNLAKQYNLITLSNSNHSGLAFSYIANKALEFWIESRFENVNIKHQEKFIDVYSYGNHIIGLCHGKDEKYMKSPFPLNLDYRTDVWLMDYFKQYEQSGKFISLIKGDIHKFNINVGKFGRYVNVPAISTNSSWVEHNFGDSQAGCLLEIVKKDCKNIQSIPIWFND